MIEGNGEFGEYSIIYVWDKKCFIYFDLEKFLDVFVVCKKINKKLINVIVIGIFWEIKNVCFGSFIEIEVFFELIIGSFVRVFDERYNLDNYFWYKIYSL